MPGPASGMLRPPRVHGSRDERHTQRHSEAIRGTQRHSEALRGTQRQPEALGQPRPDRAGACTTRRRCRCRSGSRRRRPPPATQAQRAIPQTARPMRARLSGEQPVDRSGEGGGGALRDSDEQPAVDGGAPHVSFNGFRIDADSKQPDEPSRSSYVAGIERLAAPSRR